VFHHKNTGKIRSPPLKLINYTGVIMGFSLKNWLQSTVDALFSKKAKTVRNRPQSLQAERLLVDAIRLAELPSPAPGEEPRAGFVLERLKSFNLLPEVSEAGDILVRLYRGETEDEAPILLFSDLGSRRWHPGESLARLDAENATGAGLSDSLGSAALLSIAEQWQSGDFRTGKSGDMPARGLLLLFTAKSLDDPTIGFAPILKNTRYRPFAAIGVRGLSLDRIIRPTGSYRLKITISAATPAHKKENFQIGNKVTETLIDTARTLLGITWDTGEKTKLFIRHLEAQTVYGQTPEEGLVELEIESSESALLDLAMNAVKATAGKIGEAAGLKTETAFLSFIPPGNPDISRVLYDMLGKLLRERHIRAHEETAADPASFFSGDGIPALSMGIALGHEGTERDTVNIDSIEEGRLILEKLIAETGARNDI
jgi:hypothetical protein